MIYALNEKNEKINASESSKEKVYYCPNVDCANREVILKKGLIRIPHFAHKPNSSCCYEPESQIHILCKKYIQNILNLDKEFVEYYGIKGVRPDLLYNDYAIEIQCSPIKVSEIKRRNKIYKRNNYFPVWVFYKDTFITQNKKEIFENGRPKIINDQNKSEATTPIFRLKRATIHSSFKNSGSRNSLLKSFIFTYDNDEIIVKYSSFEELNFNSMYFKKINAIKISTREVFDGILTEIRDMKEKQKIAQKIKKINTRELKKIERKLNTLPKYIHYYIFKDSNLNYAHITGSEFFDEINNFSIGMFIEEIFYKMNCCLNDFKQYIEKTIIDAEIATINIKNWRKQYSFQKDGRKYIPICRTEKIYKEKSNAYLTYDKFGAFWIPKSCSQKDDRYLYCEEWLIMKREKNK